MTDWLQMGGYASFVWPAYGVAVALLGGLALHCWRRHRLAGRRLAAAQPPPQPQA